MKLRYAALLALSVALFSCHKDNNNNNTNTNNNNNNNSTAEAAPKLCLTIPNGTVVDSGQTINISNCTQNAATYQWLIDGKQTYSTPDLTLVFTTRGGHTAKLTAYNAAATKMKDTTINFTVGYRYLTGFTFKKYPLTSRAGQPWDADGSGPDIYLQYGPNRNIDSLQTAVHQNADGTTFTLDITPNIKITPVNYGGWVFRVFDDNGSGNAPTPMTTFGGTANPIYPSRGLVNPFIITNTGDYDIELNYTVK
jgi:hypothetical protein